VDPRAGVDDVEKRIFLTLLGLEHRTLGHPACSQSLYRLRYPQNLFHGVIKEYYSGNACYHSVRYILCSRLLSKNVKIKMRKTITLRVVLCVYEVSLSR
jgi:hypothetical protein